MVMDGERCVDVLSLVSGYGRRIIVRATARFCRGLSCILGPNGAGKTTLLKTLAGLLGPLAGFISFEGRDIYSYSIRERARIVAIHLSSIPSLPLLKVRDVISLGRTPNMGLTLSGEDIRAISEAMKMTNIEDLSDRYFNQLSDGEKRRVMIAMTIARKPRVLILDEPTSFLDPFNRYYVFDIIRRIADEIPVIVSTHDIDNALRFCDKLYYIVDGELREASGFREIGEIYGNMVLDPFTLTLEPKLCNSDKSIHLISGCGTGVIYIRKYRPKNSITAGPLYPNDLDTMVLNRLGAKIITTLEPSPVDDTLKMIYNAIKLVVIDVPSYCRPQESITVVRRAIEMGKEVILIDPKSLWLDLK